MLNLSNIFKKEKAADPSSLSKDDIAKILKTTPDSLGKFEDAYRKYAIDESDEYDFVGNAKNAVQEKNAIDSYDITDNSCAVPLIKKIVRELLSQTHTYTWDRETGKAGYHDFPHCECTVNQGDIKNLHESVRPQLTGNLMKKDIAGDSCEALLYDYQRYLTDKDPEMRKQFYHLFRQGLDILDLDELTYRMIGTNPNSMSHWFPQLVEAAKHSKIFKVPSTTVAQVPITLLQLTRQEYSGLTQTTLDIVDGWATEAFALDEDKDYFVKTGTYSSKFDYRNCYVHGAKEVRELGEYLLFIHTQALQMASPLCKPVIYGVSTTNEWAVREYLRDSENNPTIYKGLPLHTEYRVFIDCNTCKVLSIVPYWDPDTMKKRFGNGMDANSPHNIHDYAIYLAHEDTLMTRYEENYKSVRDHVQEILPYLELGGQWSLDIMQNGNDFWLIDMALAQNSAFYESVPKALRAPSKENWIPELT